jgi:hypothetical protein
MSNFRSPLTILAWFALFIVTSSRLLKNDKVHWNGQVDRPALEARDEAAVLEDRSAENFRFLTAATKRENITG